MKKSMHSAFIGVACCSMAFFMTACQPGNGGGTTSGDKNYKYNPETRPVTMALGAVDQNFNPFFYTAQNDGEVIGPTQLPLITADGTGSPACGQNEATVALDYKITMYDESGKPTDDGDSKGSTVYEFVIKNGIKFSDGEALTIKDVLFNLYVYLDPAYTGSSTIYSTNIKGLTSYRAQQLLGDGNNDYDYTAQFRGKADKRYSDLLEYDKTGSSITTPTDQMEKDMMTVSKLFREELSADWSNNVGSVASYQDEYLFTEDWEVFYYSENFIQYQYETVNGNRVRKKNSDGKFLTTIDEGGAQISLRTSMNQALSEDKISEYMSDNNVDRETARLELMRAEAINTIYRSYLIDSADGKTTRPAATGKLTEIITQWATAGNIVQELLNDEMTIYYNEKTSDGGLAVTSISGITTDKVTSFNGVKGEKLNGTHDLLRIEINGVDPAAIWNFGFSVTPMHYYSGSYKDPDTGETVDYVNLAKTTAANDDKVSNRFGVKFSDSKFFDAVLNAPSKVARPVGAGPYKSRNNRVYSGGVAEYERNTYFESVGEGIENAKIKYLSYRYVTDDKIIDSLKTGSIDYGMPQCKPSNIKELEGSNLENIQYDANGFGYVGINPKLVPDRAVRQAIMKAMNINTIVRSYYTSSYANVIYRPLSLTSWVYTDATAEEREEHFTEWDDISYNPDVKVIETLVESAGWRKNADDVYTKNNKTLKLTFTIAGDSADHPAYQMFLDAKKVLEKCGFEINVTNHPQALAMLAQGKLAVWAAAWSTGIDPDMYQIYHMDSTATSVKNWGYDVIKANANNMYDYELGVIRNLSKLIEEGRSTLNRTSRKETYMLAMDMVMDLAIELPTYQRRELAVYNSVIIDSSSLTAKPSVYEAPINKLWELDYN